MEPVLNQTEKNKRFNKKILFKVFKVSSSILVASIILSIIFSKYTNKIVSTIVEELIELNSAGLYKISYKTIDYDFFNQVLTLTDLTFSYDTLDERTLDYVRKNQQSLFSATIPYLYIDVSDIWTVYLNKELKIKGLRVHQPSLTIKSYSEKHGIGWQQDAGSLYDLISGQLEVFQINNLDVKNGYFKFEKNAGSKRSYSIKDISFKIDNFLLDENARSNKEKFFYTDDIDIELSNQKLLLKDSIHTLFFKKLLLSTTRSEISVDSLIITERENYDRQKNDNSNKYDVYIPEFKMIDIDFDRAYHEGLLKIGDLTIRNPKINLTNNPKKKQADQDSTKISFSSLALNYFENIAIDNFQLVNASLAYSKKTLEKSQNFSLDSFNIKLTQFKLDSSSIQDESRPVYYDEIDFSIKDYRFNLPDSIHTLSFSLLTGSTAKRKLAFQNFSIRPRKDVDIFKLLVKNKKNKIYNLSFPNFEINRLNGHEFLNSDTLTVEEVQIFNPDIQITQYEKLEFEKSKSKFEIDNLYPLIEDFLDAAYINKLNLVNGHLTYLSKNKKLQPLLTSQNFNVELGNITMDSNSVNLNKLLSAEFLGIKAEKTIYEAPQKNITANFNAFSYSSVLKSLTCNDLELTRAETADSLGEDESILAKEIHIGGFDINQFIFLKKRTLDFVEINEPLITYHFGKGTVQDTTKKDRNWWDEGILQVNKLVLKDGEIDFKAGKEKSVKANNIFFEVDNLLKDTVAGPGLSVDNYLLSLEKFAYTDDLKNYVYTVNSVRYEPFDSTLSLIDLHVSMNESDSNKSHFKIDVPKFSISNWKPLDIYSKKEIITRKIQITDPDVNLVLPFKEEDENSVAKFAWNNLIHKIDADEIIVENGKMNMRKKTENDSVYLQSDHVNLTINKMNYDSLMTNKSFLFSENITSTLTNFLITFYHSKDTFRIAELSNSSGNANFSLNNVFVARYRNGTGEKQLNLKLKKAFLGEVDYDKLNQRDIDIGHVLIYQPEIDLNLSKNKTKTDLKDVLLLKSVKLDTNIVRSVKIGQINLNSGNCRIKTPDSIYSKPVQLSNLEVEVDAFFLDHQFNGKLLNSDNVRVGFDGFDYHLPDSLNYLTLGRISVSVSDSMLIFKDFKSRPKINKYEYGPTVGDQTDYLDIESESVVFKGVSFPEFILNRKIVAQNLDINNLNIYAFRDKRIPRKTERLKYLPQKYLMNFPYLVNIDTLKVNNAKIVYEEFAEEASRPGLVDFSNLNAQLVNVCNIPDEILDKPLMFFKADTKLMDEGSLQVFMEFDLAKDDYPFFLGAKLDKMNLTTFNKMLEPNAFVQVKKGKCQQLSMSANADDKVAIGDMIFEYDNLKISLINKNTFENRGMGPVIGSFFANAFIINKNNPRLLMTKEGRIYFERNKYRSVFNYWAKIFFSGIVSSIGAKSNKKDIKKYEKMEEKMSETE